jgi:hypothetical protein
VRPRGNLSVWQSSEQEVFLDWIAACAGAKDFGLR